MELEHIQAADFHRYNANSRGTNTSDCVKRSISLAFDIPYVEVTKLLNQRMHEMRETKWNVQSVFETVIRDLGGSSYNEIDEIITLDEFADEHPTGSYAVLTGEPNAHRSSHLVCVRDGQVWDSWDSRDQKVFGYYEAHAVKNLRKLNKYMLRDMGHNYLEPVVTDEILKYMNKRDYVYSRYEVTSTARNYNIIANCSITLEKDDGFSKDRNYNFKINLTIEPSWTDEEIVEFIKKTGKQRAYDRMYTINEQEKKLKEASEIIREAKDSGTDISQRQHYLTSQERRFINSLPGWAIPLIKNIRIQDPNSYYDSYHVRMYKHPKDDMHPDIETFVLEGYDAAEVRQAILEYGKDFSIQGIDYEREY